MTRNTTRRNRTAQSEKKVSEPTLPQSSFDDSKTSLPAKKWGSSTSPKKRKFENVAQNDEDQGLTKTHQSKKLKKEEEKRLTTYRSKAPQTFLRKLERAQTQRMIVIGRTRSGSGQNLHEDIDIVGTTGNIYTVTIGRLPSCTCRDHAKGNECKHKVYALNTVLRAPYDLQYQRAFLTTEVEEILTNAPSIPNGSSNSDEDYTGTQKPIEGECPICYMDFDPENNEITWCKAACGNNMHKECFNQWVASQRGQEVRCVYCRQPWQMDKGDLESIKKLGQKSGDGYINVAEQFGLSQVRDYSSYHQPWVRRRHGYG